MLFEVDCLCLGVLMVGLIVVWLVGLGGLVWVVGGVFGWVGWCWLFVCGEFAITVFVFMVITRCCFCLFVMVYLVWCLSGVMFFGGFVVLCFCVGELGFGIGFLICCFGFGVFY